MNTEGTTIRSFTETPNIGEFGNGMHVVKSKIASRKKSKVVTTYNLQRRLWIDALFQFSIQQDIEMTKLPSVLTSNSMQEREADFIIFDSVLSVANKLGDLGLAQDPKLMNVVHTRGRRGMVTLHHENVTVGTISETWKSKKDKTGRGVFEVFCLIPY